MEQTFGCNSHIWFHHAKPYLVRILHKKHKKEPFHPTIEWENHLHKNHTGCPHFNGLPPFHRSKLEKLPAVHGPNKKKIFIERNNFTEFRTNYDYC